jgi:hypothetical protein
MTVALDHILWAAPDLEQGARLFAALTGVEPAAGGSHPGFGTRNKLAGLGDGVYFEIISPDPEQDLAGNRGGQIAALRHPGLLTFAIRTSDLPALRRQATQAGLSLSEPIPMSRTRPDGVRLTWTILHMSHAGLGDAIPFAIDWGTSPHPSASTPAGCRLRSLLVLHPEPEPLQSIYRTIGLSIEVHRSPRPGLLANLATPRGDVVLLSAE